MRSAARPLLRELPAALAAPELSRAAPAVPALAPDRLRRREWLSLVAVLASSGTAGAVALGAVAVGEPVPWPPLRLLDGRVLAPEDWRDIGAVVVFWATWCPYCRRHNPHVQRLHAALAGQPVRVLGVSLDSDAALVRRHLAAENLHFPVTLDEARLRPLLSPRRVLPMTCVVDRDGRLRSVIPGEMFEDDVMALGAAAMQRG